MSARKRPSAPGFGMTVADLGYCEIPSGAGLGRLVIDDPVADGLLDRLQIRTREIIDDVRLVFVDRVGLVEQNQLHHGSRKAVTLTSASTFVLAHTLSPLPILRAVGPRATALDANAGLWIHRPGYVSTKRGASDFAGGADPPRAVGEGGWLPHARSTSAPGAPAAVGIASRQQRCIASRRLVGRSARARKPRGVPRGPAVSNRARLPWRSRLRDCPREGSRGRFRRRSKSAGPRPLRNTESGVRSDAGCRLPSSQTPVQCRWPSRS